MTSSSSSSHRRAERLRSLLSRSDALGAETDACLACCESDLLRAAELVAPTVARTKALRAARDEIRSSLATSERALEHLDAARRLESVVLAGPRGDNLGSFIMALNKLDEAAAFLSKHKTGLVAAAAAAESAAALRSDGNALALREFEVTMRGAYQQQQHNREQRQQQQQGGLAGVEATRETAAATSTSTTTTSTSTSTHTRLRSLARALVAGGGPEASSPSVMAFLSSEKEAKR